VITHGASHQPVSHLKRVVAGRRTWFLDPPTSTILHSGPPSFPEAASISNLYSEAPIVFNRALRTSSVEHNCETQSKFAVAQIVEPTVRGHIPQRRYSLKMIQKAMRVYMSTVIDPCRRLTTQETPPAVLSSTLVYYEL
jgi:hypothetical protein